MTRIFWTFPDHVPHDGAIDHPHGPGCGHLSAPHAGQHVDYLVEGHVHHAHEGHWDECDPSVFGGASGSPAAGSAPSSPRLER